MSLLLEALKKSDQQRRKQAVPDLATVHVSTEPPRRARGVRALVYAGLILLALGVGWWLKPGAPATDPNPPATDTARPSTPDASTQRSTTPAPSQSPPVVAPNNPVTEVSPPSPGVDQPRPVMPQLRADDYQLSMHYYVEAASSRLVRINNVLYREGGRLRDGAVVAEIRPDGVLLRQAGAELLIPANR